MKIAVVLYSDFTALDMVGPFEVLSGVPGAELFLVADEAGPVISDHPSLVIEAQFTFDEVPQPDVIVVPGGMGSSRQMEDGALHQWLRAADEAATWTTSVCTGSLILGAAGLLRGRRATSHWLGIDQLPGLGAVAVKERVVVDGHYMTAAGVSAGIDMGLTLAAKLAGDEVAQTRQLAMEYAPRPPFDAGTPESAPRAVLQGLLDRSEEMLTGNQRS